MAGNSTTPGNAMSNAWASAASKLGAFMPNANQINGSDTPVGGPITGGRRRKRSKKGTKKRSKKAGRKTRRHRKKKMIGFNIF